jgi:hypothetical protein
VGAEIGTFILFIIIIDGFAHGFITVRLLAGLVCLIFCLLVGGFAGFLFKTCCRHAERNPPRASSTAFLTAFGWALESYKQEIEGFEIWNAMSRTLILVGSIVMYPQKRFVCHISVMVWSFMLHIRFRPYKDHESNVCAILFCICDILGAITAFQTYENAPSAGLQIIFILVTFITMVVVAVAMTRGIRAQVAESQTTLLSRTRNDLFASYTPLEKKLLFPVLAIVWLLIKCFQQIDRKKGLTGGGNDDRTSGDNVEEEKKQNR